MKKLIFFLAILFLAGCVTVNIPKYLQEEFPYRKTFNASFEKTFTACLRSLEESGWRISETTHPGVFDPAKDMDKSSKYRVLIFTEIRQTPLFLLSSYMTLNAYLKSVDETHTDVEFRYLSVIALPFKNINSYQNDRLISKLFDRITENLKK